MVSSPALYTGLVAVVASERLAEVVVARRNDRRLLAVGGVEEGGGHYPWMVALHTAFPVACVADVWWLRRPCLPPLGAMMLVAIAASMGLRAWVMATLGPRWTTRVLIVPGWRVVRAGPYRWLRHPNYLAVVVEMAALPLVHSAWLTAGAFSLLNLTLLGRRVRVEEAALARWCPDPGETTTRGMASGEA